MCLIKGCFCIVINICAQVATRQVCGVFLHDFVGNETELRRPRCMQLVARPNLRRTVRWMHAKAIFAICENCHSCHCFFGSRLFCQSLLQCATGLNRALKSGDITKIIKQNRDNCHLLFTPSFTTGRLRRRPFQNVKDKYSNFVYIHALMQGR